MHKVIAFIPVRGGSKSIPLKNIKLFCGQPLVYWTIKAAEDCAEIDEIYVATDSEQIRETVEGFMFKKVKVVSRGKETSTDTASTESAMLEFASQHKFDDIVLIQATSPLLQSVDLTNGIKKYLTEQFDSVLSVVPQKRFIWQTHDSNVEATPWNYDPAKRPRRQEMDDYYVENGAFYITSRDALLQTKLRLSGRIGIVPMAEETYFEIDEPSDWIIMEQLKAKQQNEAKTNHMLEIKLLISDVDGTLTDAGMYYNDDGSEAKKFNTRDGMGIGRLRAKGVKVMLLTSEDTEIVKRRAEKLQVDYCFMGVKNKEVFLESFFDDNKSFSWDTTAYIGDDINDVAAMKKVALAAAPADAMQDTKQTAGYICRLSGGQGCVREFCEYLIQNI